MNKLNKTEIDENLVLLDDGWTFANDSISREFKFKDFVHAFQFMINIADAAEKLNHHPDWSNVYNKVIISLSTHDAGGVSLKDFELASRIDTIFKAV